MAQNIDTGLRLSKGEDWLVPADTRLHPDRDDDVHVLGRTAISSHGVLVPAATLRRIGWLDQKGRIYGPDDQIPRPFDGGSLTPLLIDARED